LTERWLRRPTAAQHYRLAANVSSARAARTENPYPARALRRSFVLSASAGTDVACSLAAAPFRPGADPYI